MITARFSRADGTCGGYFSIRAKAFEPQVKLRGWIR
jgi:hypothetical protein